MRPSRCADGDEPGQQRLDVHDARRLDPFGVPQARRLRVDGRHRTADRHGQPVARQRPPLPWCRSSWPRGCGGWTSVREIADSDGARIVSNEVFLPRLRRAAPVPGYSMRTATSGPARAAMASTTPPLLDHPYGWWQDAHRVGDGRFWGRRPGFGLLRRRGRDAWPRLVPPWWVPAAMQRLGIGCSGGLLGYPPFLLRLALAWSIGVVAELLTRMGRGGRGRSDGRLADPHRPLANVWGRHLPRGRLWSRPSPPGPSSCATRSRRRTVSSTPSCASVCGVAPAPIACFGRSKRLAARLEFEPLLSRRCVGLADGRRPPARRLRHGRAGHRRRERKARDSPRRCSVTWRTARATRRG